MGEGEGCRGRAPVWCLVPGSLWWRGKHAPIPPLFFLIGVGGLGCLSLHLVCGGGRMLSGSGAVRPVWPVGRLLVRLCWWVPWWAGWL